MGGHDEASQNKAVGSSDHTDRAAEPSVPEAGNLASSFGLTGGVEVRH